MESLTFELAVATGDPYDRTLGIIGKCDRTVVIARALRVAPQVRLGEILLWIDRLAIAWAVPQMPASEHIHDTWDAAEKAIGYGPFDH